MAGPTLGNTLFGMPTVSIGGTTFYTTGSAEVGVEGSTEFGRVAELAAPHTGVFVSRQPFVTATLAEVNESAIGTLWDVPDEDVWCNPALKTPTSTACVLTHGSTVYTLTAGYITSAVSVSFGESDLAAVTVTYSGIDADGSGGCGTIVTT